MDSKLIIKKNFVSIFSTETPGFSGVTAFSSKLESRLTASPAGTTHDHTIPAPRPAS